MKKLAISLAIAAVALAVGLGVTIASRERAAVAEWERCCDAIEKHFDRIQDETKSAIRTRTGGGIGVGGGFGAARRGYLDGGGDGREATWRTHISGGQQETLVEVEVQLRKPWRLLPVRPTVVILAGKGADTPTFVERLRAALDAEQIPSTTESTK